MLRPYPYFGMSKSLFKRIAGWLAIDPNDLWLDEANPEGEVALVLAEMESGLAQAKDAVAKAAVKEHRLEQRLKEALAASVKWDARTDAALHAGDEEAARRALERKHSYQQTAQAIQAALDRQRQTVADMKASLDSLQARVQDIHRQREQGY